MLNEYQKHNLKEWDDAGDESRREFLNDYWSHCDIQKFMKCTVCGNEKITKNILKFFGSPDKVKCYDCQNLNK
jgi:hypothetical protein